MEDYDSLIPTTHDHDDKKKKATFNLDLSAGNKKSGSSGGGGTGGGGASSLKSCQAEKCTADLSDAKQYHKRHKVCEHHAKAQVVVVGGIRQRFCQQCSRFHELAEFDDAKRSCRRRLAGHNERRRKNSSSDAANGQAQGGGGGGGGSERKGGTSQSQSQMKEIVFGQVVDNPTNFKHFHIR